MQHVIVKYPVRHPLLKSYIKFFWELNIENAKLNHRFIPQRNINLRFNLSDTPQYAIINGNEHLLDSVNFSGLQDRFMNASLKLNGNVHVLGVCFYPEGPFPFFNIPVSEFKNQLLGANEIGIRLMNEIWEQLKEEPDIFARLNIVENEFARLLINGNKTPDNIRQIFKALNENCNSAQISGFCSQNKISIRSLERLFNKYVGVSASTYLTLNRFHVSANQLIYNNIQKFSDLAFDNGYFDQMHFIRDFKRFTGNTPKNFVQQQNSILQIGKYT
jgi:AraC-like DNA-binding protein